MASSSDTPDGFDKWSSNAFFSASASASLAACLDASSASASAIFFIMSCAEGNNWSALVAMLLTPSSRFYSFGRMPHCILIISHCNEKIIRIGRRSLIYIKERRSENERMTARQGGHDHGQQDDRHGEADAVLQFGAGANGGDGYFAKGAARSL